MTPDDEASLPKTLIARYRIEAQIGSGGMGVVYRATHTWTGRPVAIKVLHPLQPNSAAYRKRFMREARAAVSLRHPNVVDVLHMDQDERERVYLVMELLVGQPLSAALENRGPLSLAETCTRLLPIMDAVAHAHRAGIVHRDIKPDNIFLAETATGIVPKLLDFGVAKLVQEGGTTSITGSGQLVGTPRYMAPEQVAGTDAATPAVDVWALGMVAYECLWGHHPLGAAASLPALLLKVTRGEVPPLATRCPDLPAHAAAAIDRALQGDPRDRWPTVDALAGALSAAVGGDPDARFGPSAGARDRELTTGGAVRGDTAGLHQQAPATQARGRLKLVGAGLLALLAAIVWVLTERAAEDVRGFPPRLEVRVEEAPTASAQQAKVARGEGAREAPAYAREVPAASTAGSQVVSGVEARPPVGLPALRAAQVRRQEPAPTKAGSRAAVSQGAARVQRQRAEAAAPARARRGRARRAHARPSRPRARPAPSIPPPNPAPSARPARGEQVQARAGHERPPPETAPRHTESAPEVPQSPSPSHEDLPPELIENF